MPLVFLDSCIVIYLIQAPDPIRDAVRQALHPWRVTEVADTPIGATHDN